jgi:chromosome segregation ATPase
MALTRKMLTALGVESEKIDQIVEEHSKTVNEIKEQKDELAKQLETYKEEADKLKTTEEELEKVKAELDAIDVEGMDKKYKDLKAEYDEFKAGVEAKNTRAQKAEAYRQLLLDAGVSEKRVASVLKVSDIDNLEIDEDGKVKNAEKLTENIKSEWADFITTEGKKGADVSKPPTNTGGDTFEKLSLQDKMNYANEHPDDASVKAWLGK